MAQLTYVQVANNATYAFGKTEGNLNVNSALSANNATNAFGKAEGALNVNSALSANNSTYAYGKSEGALNANSANNATYAFGKTEGNLNVNSAVGANNSTYAYGKTEGNLNVNSAVGANNSTYAYGKTEGNLNVNSAVGANGVTGATVNTNASAVLVGANVYINTSAHFVGNSSVNLYFTQSALFINGNTGSANQVLTSNGSTISWANGGGGGGASVTISANTPASANAGDLWWDSDDGALRIFYADGTSNSWVDAFAPGAAVFTANASLTANNLSVIGTLSIGKTIGTVQAISSSAAQNADLALNANATVLAFTMTGSDGAFVTGIAGGVDGRIVFIHNTHATYTLKFAHDSANSTATNRIYLPSTELWLGPRRSYQFYYSGGESRWRVLN